MVEPAVDVVGVGNAIVDVIANVPESYLGEHNMVKGSMTLVEAGEAVVMYDRMPPGIEISGGSAANTAAGVASLGARAAYIGKVRDDQLGEVFRHDMRAGGVTFETSAATAGDPTARSLVHVTPDGERTMNTCLGISAFLHPDDIDPDLVANAAITYCEGYLWDREVAKDAIRFAMEVAESAGRVVSMTLSDSFCVDRHRDEWMELIGAHVSLVFANEAEVCALFETDDFDEACRRLAEMVEVAAVTRSEAGSVVLSAGERVDVPASPIDRLIDATGAGDLYASGFLYGLSAGASLPRCAQLGSIAAAEVITHLGARPLVSLRDLVAADGSVDR